MDINKQQNWQIMGSTVRGASHVRNGMPNQDAISWHPDSGEAALPIIMTVSDGHGGAKYFRSDRGAQIAVDVAKAVIQDFLVDHEKTENLSLIKNSAEEWLPKTLVRSWREVIFEDIKKNPLSPENHLNRQETASSDQLSGGRDLAIAYGSTLLIAVLTEKYLLFLQLGDGDILVVSDDSKVYRPVAEDTKLIANETTSLCSKDAWRDFRVSFNPVTTDPPALLLLSTDGYANSFRDDEGFKKVAADIHQMIGTEGSDYIKNNLEEWLTDATNNGSGDDISVGIIYRTDAFNKEIRKIVLPDQDAVRGDQRIQPSEHGVFQPESDNYTYESDHNSSSLLPSLNGTEQAPESERVKREADTLLAEHLNEPQNQLGIVNNDGSGDAKP